MEAHRNRGGRGPRASGDTGRFPDAARNATTNCWLAARAFCAAVTRLDLSEAFFEQGMADDFETALDTAIAYFEESQQAESSAGQKITGAGDALEELIHTGMEIRKSLDAIERNFFKGSAAVIGE